VTGLGEGAFTLAAQPDGRVMIGLKTEGSVDDTAGSRRIATETITLTPLTNQGRSLPRRGALPRT